MLLDPTSSHHWILRYPTGSHLRISSDPFGGTRCYLTSEVVGNQEISPVSDSGQSDGIQPSDIVGKIRDPIGSYGMNSTWVDNLDKRYYDGVIDVIENLDGLLLAAAKLKKMKF